MHICLIQIYVQESFTEVTQHGQLFFRDGTPHAGLHRRYMLEHAGSRDKISAHVMWDFVQSFSNNEIGILRHYEKTGTISRRMHVLIRHVRAKFGHMLVDVPG